MQTWFKKERPDLLEPELQAPARHDPELTAHQGLDRALRRALKPGEIKFNESAFLKRLERRLEEAPELSGAEKLKQSFSNLFLAASSNGYAPVRFAALVMMPLAALLVYGAMQRDGMEMVPAMESASGRSLHEEMAPDAQGDLAAEREMAMQMGAGVDDTTAGAAKRAMDMEFDRLAQETTQIQEDLLLKNLEMAATPAAKKTALEQLIDFYKSNGLKERALAREAELKKIAPPL